MTGKETPPQSTVQKVLIVGGGSAGWMTAAALSTVLGTARYELHLVESEEIGTVGVGEATIPYIRDFNRLLQIDEAQFVRETSATFKLGIEFVDWTRQNHSYIHPFGQIGAPLGKTAFQHLFARGTPADRVWNLEDYSVCSHAARNGKFAPPPRNDRSAWSTMGYAYHFDATAYAQFLRTLATQRGVVRHEGRIDQVTLDPMSGAVQSVSLSSGERISADLFIDCSGMRGLLGAEALGTPFIDWSDYLPCDGAWVAQTPRQTLLPPYTRSKALSAGWQWRIPLQNRTGNGYVFSSRFVTPDAAREQFLANLDASPSTEPRLIRFRTGRRQSFWTKNVIAIGLSGGFLEPLESTSLHLIHSGIIKLLDLWPRSPDEPLLAEQYNQAMAAEFDAIRDFLILHYKATERDDTPFWRYCRDMPIPDTLAYKIAHFRHSGRIVLTRGDLFQAPSWLAVLVGQGIVPEDYDPLADQYPVGDIQAHLLAMRSEISRLVATLPDHETYIQRLIGQAV